VAIDMDEVLDAVERMVAEEGFEAVSVDRVASDVSISRATMYRTIPSKEHLLALLFERMTDRVSAEVREATKEDGRTAKERLRALLRAHIHGSVNTRGYLFVLFSRDWFPPEMYAKFNRWRHDFERTWVDAVRAAADEGALLVEDPLIATRLLLGMCVWVSRWYRPDANMDVDFIADEAIRLVHCDAG
jgi:AcrR family transcriptional regulator